MLKKFLNSVLFIILLLIPLALTACTPQKINRQTELKDVIWKTQDSNAKTPTLEFLVLQDNAYHFGCIEFDDRKYEIAMVWGDMRFDISLVNYYGKVSKENEGNKICGHYEILATEEVELQISSDEIFNGNCEGMTITVKAVEINPENYGAFDRHEIGWEAENCELEIFVYQSYRRFGVGDCTVDGIQKDIVFYWLENNRFEAFELSDGKQTETCLFAGSYIDGSGSVILKLETNLLFKYLNTILLKNKELPLAQPDALWYPNE